MKKTIITAPNSVLQKSCSKVEVFDENLKELVDEMWKLVGEHAGLAAPQVGLAIQVAVIQWDQKTEVLVNPKVIKERGTWQYEEMCLSLPGVKVRVDRPKMITIEYQNILGEKQKRKWKGMFARAALHEIDHLKGKLITDYERTKV